MTATLHLQALYHWCDNGLAPLPELSAIDAKQRRRLSPLAKLALAAREGLAQTADLAQIDHILWCSSYGDEHKTLAILQDIARDEAPSPTAFATSVHNATAGLYSMLYHDDIPSTSMNVGHTEFVHALSYAHALLQSQAASQVLLVCADEPLPEIYVEQGLQQAYAMACVLQAPHTQQPANLHLSSTEIKTQPHTEQTKPQALQFAEFWHGNDHSLQLDAWQLCKS